MISQSLAVPRAKGFLAPVDAVLAGILRLAVADFLVLFQERPRELHEATLVSVTEQKALKYAISCA